MPEAQKTIGLGTVLLTSPSATVHLVLPSLTPRIETTKLFQKLSSMPNTALFTPLLEEISSKHNFLQLSLMHQQSTLFRDLNTNFATISHKTVKLYIVRLSAKKLPKTPNELPCK